MSKLSIRAFVLVGMMLLASASPLTQFSKADPEIELQVDMSHMILVPGESMNLTLTIENNGSSIETYDVETTTDGLSLLWTATPTSNSVSNVLPTYNATTTIAVQLAETATPSDNGKFTIIVNESDGVASTSIDVYVSVAVVYNPHLDATGIGDQGLLAIQPGQSVDLSIPVSNHGSVMDSYLLEVGEEPDLTGWWANYSSSGSSNTSNTAPSWSASVSDVLTFGNSYTSANGLSSMLEELLRSANSPSNTSDFTGGGSTIANHWDDVNTSGSAQNLSLASGVWDTVVVQDQSQIPGFLRTHSDWLASKNGSIDLAERIDTEGAAMMLMMTWGRRSGDAMNPTLYPNYTVMQDRLEQGYIDYRDNISLSTSAEIYIAPVGLAFKHIHDSIVASGGNPQSPTSTFYGLYSTDGSHPSTSGSYLTACVLFAALTGDSPVGLTDNTTMDATLRLTLQQAAAEVVFNGSSTYDYPWEASGTIQAMNQHSSFPAGWEVRWLDDQIENLSANGQETATLRVSIPSDASPGATGVRLYAGSLFGNLTTSTLMVIDVQANYDLQVDFLNGDDEFIPGQQTNTSIRLTNIGTTSTTYDYALSVLSGPCTAALLTYSSTIDVDASEDLPFQVDVGSIADVGDVCSLRLTSTLASDSGISFVRDFSFEVDREIAFVLQGPNGPTVIDPVIESTIEVRVFNTGTETETFSLQVNSNASSPVSLLLDSPSSVSVAADASAVWTLKVTAAEGSLGIYERLVTVTHDSLLDQNLTLEFDVQTLANLNLQGPLDGRIVVQSGGESSVTILIENDGTSDLLLDTFTIAGLPGGVNAVLPDVNQFLLEAGATHNVSLNVSASAATSARTDSLSLRLFSDGAEALLAIELQVVDRTLAQLSPNTNQIIAGPSASTNVTIEVTNIGTLQDTFLLSIGAGETSNYFELSLSKTSVNLGIGQSETVVLSVRETSTGANANGLPINIVATSTLDSASTDVALLTLIPMTASSDLTVFADDSTAEASGTIEGTLIVTNTGNSVDVFSLSSVGLDCELESSVLLQPGASTLEVPWTCEIPSDALAGTNAFSFRAVSSARSDAIQNEVVVYTIDATWDTNSVVAITVDNDDLTIPYLGGSSITVTVTNLANIAISGKLTMVGVGDGVFDIRWNNTLGEVTDAFALEPGASEIFVVRFNALTTDETNADLRVRALVQVDSSSIDAESDPIEITVEGEPQPPQGVTLLGIELGKGTTLQVMAVGYILFALAVMVIRLRKPRTPTTEPDEESEEEEDDKQYALGPNECRMDTNRRISCPSCEARLAVPGGNEPPFRFTCPTCDSSIRVVEYGSSPKF
ncbi:MAG: hypothetical protein CMA41_05390 [Euryarchaeota archaeon]|jgi:uncharacterized membrane protein|nr:hypothetical protein [Euryarchaeota archaeon]|tara:strand:+ start:32560 stop:36543 length:3984 start_codon:yes stop_codon:yes gene_type:complete